MTDVQMDYDLMDQMADLFREGAQHMGDLNNVMRTVAGRLEDGALLGRGGDALADAIRTNLASRVQLLGEKLEELSFDILGALTSLRDGDQEAATRFRD